MNRYTMILALSRDLSRVVLLLKPESHPNPLFRNKWTLPGGLIESGETDAESASRELFEETGLIASAADLWQILSLRCNCDPTESEHEVTLFAVTLDNLDLARGVEPEPVRVFSNLPDNRMWYLPQMIELVFARLGQPR